MGPALWKITLSYDGTPFHGWQVQPGLPTVQGTLAQALHHITGDTVLPQGSGRTDAGVHALAQVASFSLAAPIPPANLHRALNRALPSSIRVLAAEHAPQGFHARHSALQKTYEYRIFPRVRTASQPPPTSAPTPSSMLPAPTSSSRPKQRTALRSGETPALALSAAESENPPANLPDRICSPMLAPFVWDCPFPLDLHRLRHAATQVLGTHDFTSFAASDPDLATRSLPQDRVPPLRDSLLVAKVGLRASARTVPADLHEPHEPEEPDALPPHATPVRTIHQSEWLEHEDLLIYRVTGSGFLHHMVRNLVGTFVETAYRRLEPTAIADILRARNRSAAGPTAPARGLFLVKVDY